MACYAEREAREMLWDLLQQEDLTAEKTKKRKEEADVGKRGPNLSCKDNDFVIKDKGPYTGDDWKSPWKKYY